MIIPWVAGWGRGAAQVPTTSHKDAATARWPPPYLILVACPATSSQLAMTFNRRPGVSGWSGARSFITRNQASLNWP